jgi:hypothetical protein
MEKYTRRKAKRASMVIEPEETQDISESQLKHYNNLGYKPYLSHGGKIKWLSIEQHTYETIKYNNRKRLVPKIRFRPKRPNSARFYRIWFKRIASHWILLVLLLIIIALLLFLQPILNYAASIKL